MIVISPAPVEAKAIPPVPAFKAKAVAPVTLPTVIVLAEEPVPILMGVASASFPILIAPALEFSSNTPSASRSSVSSELIVISPAPVEAKAIPPVPAFKAKAVAPVTLPILTVLANAPVEIDTVLSPCVPILIA